MNVDWVSFKVRVCPHIQVTVNTYERWSVFHTYTLHGACETCGPVLREERRPAYAA